MKPSPRHLRFARAFDWAIVLFLAASAAGAPSVATVTMAVLAIPFLVFPPTLPSLVGLTVASGLLFSVAMTFNASPAPDGTIAFPFVPIYGFLRAVQVVRSR